MQHVGRVQHASLQREGSSNQPGAHQYYLVARNPGQLHCVVARRGRALLATPGFSHSGPAHMHPTGVREQVQP